MKEKSRVVVASANQGGNITPEGLEELEAAQKRAEDQARIDSIKQVRRNKFAEMIDQKIYITEWTHPCLFNKESNRQMTVSEFYPKLNLALDKFFHFDEWELSLTNIKRESLNKAGFKYVFLTPDKDFADILADLETQVV